MAEVNIGGLDSALKIYFYFRCRMIFACLLDAYSGAPISSIIRMKNESKETGIVTTAEMDFTNVPPHKSTWHPIMKITSTRTPLNCASHIPLCLMYIHRGQIKSLLLSIIYFLNLIKRSRSLIHKLQCCYFLFSVCEEEDNLSMNAGVHI